jgi:hypothetical protein
MIAVLRTLSTYLAPNRKARAGEADVHPVIEEKDPGFKPRRKQQPHPGARTSPGNVPK